MRVPPPKDGWRRQQWQRINAQTFARLGLTNLLRVRRGATWNLEGVKRWKEIARDLVEEERLLTKWEEEHPEEYKSMPWYEAREEYKANRPSEGPKWYEVANALAACNYMLLSSYGKASRKPRGRQAPKPIDVEQLPLSVRELFGQTPPRSTSGEDPQR